MKNDLMIPATDKEVLGNKYDPEKPLNDPRKERFIHEIIAQGGNKKRAFEITYLDGQKIARDKANYPYMYSNTKSAKARYEVLLNRYLDGVGLDAKSMLVKTAKMMDRAMKDNDINGFDKMVHTVMKLRGEDVRKIMSVTKSVKVSEQDIEAINGLFEEL